MRKSVFYVATGFLLFEENPPTSCPPTLDPRRKMEVATDREEGLAGVATLLTLVLELAFLQRAGHPAEP